jgi:GTP-binding protein YchF
MSLKCGIVGLPNVGKSTLFNALTKAGIAAENYPFCTIEPNVGVVELPDPRLAQLSSHRQARAHRAGHRRVRRHRRPGGRRQQGRRPGQPVPGHIRETDAIVNVVRCFEDDNVIHVAGKVDPISDIEVIQTELCLADLATVEKSLHRYTKAAAPVATRKRQAGGGAGEVPGRAERGKPVRSIDFSKEELALLKPLCLITAKPAMFVGNVAETASRTTPSSTAARIRRKQNAPVVAICAKTEAELADMSDEDRRCSWPRWGRTSRA